MNISFDRPDAIPTPLPRRHRLRIGPHHNGTSDAPYFSVSRQYKGPGPLRAEPFLHIAEAVTSSRCLKYLYATTPWRGT